MSESRRSRLGWPGAPQQPAPDARRQRRIAVAVLYTAVILNMVLTVLVFSYVLALKDAHDTETTRVQQQVDRNNCALMDALPAGGPLVPLRARYHCGPGLPTSTP
jgi:hypothetical protein